MRPDEFGLWRYSQNLAMSILSGMLAACAHAPNGFGALATIALVPWLLGSRRARPIEAFALGAATGCVSVLASAHWLPEALRTLGATAGQSLLVSLLAALWCGGLLFGAIGFVLQALHGRSVGMRIVAPALFFGLGEVGMTESSWGAPLLLLGTTQASVPGVAQLAVVIGVPGLSIFLLVVNGAIAAWLAEGRSARSLAIGSCAAWLAALVFGLPLAIALRPVGDAEAKTLLIVQPDIPRTRRWDPAFQHSIFEEIRAATARALTESDMRPDAILWTENLLTSPVDASDPLGRGLQRAVDEWGVPVVTGLVRSGAESSSNVYYRNSIVWWSPRFGPRTSIDKVRAIPWVEANRDGWIDAVGASFFGEAARGPRVEEAEAAGPLRGEFTLAPLLCFEVLFPRLAADRRSADSVAIVNLADDSWVVGEMVDAQLVAAAAFRAIEQRLTLVRVSHGGLSVVIDPFGRVVASLAPDRVASMQVEVRAAPRPSACEKWMIVLVPLVVGCAAARGAARGAPSDERADG
jgi:apolipoprotein N-acyltransferase